MTSRSWKKAPEGRDARWVSWEPLPKGIDLLEAKRSGDGDGWWVYARMSSGRTSPGWGRTRDRAARAALWRASLEDRS